MTLHAECSNSPLVLYAYEQNTIFYLKIIPVWQRLLLFFYHLLNVIPVQILLWDFFSDVLNATSEYNYMAKGKCTIMIILRNYGELTCSWVLVRLVPLPKIHKRKWEHPRTLDQGLFFDHKIRSITFNFILLLLVTQYIRFVV